MKNLFNEEINDIPLINNTTYGYFKIWKINNMYHKSQFKEISCQHCKYFSYGKFNKCKLMGSSSSNASDIRSNYLCIKFEGK